MSGRGGAEARAQPGGARDADCPSGVGQRRPEAVRDHSGLHSSDGRARWLGQPDPDHLFLSREACGSAGRQGSSNAPVVRACRAAERASHSHPRIPPPPPPRGPRAPHVLCVRCESESVSDEARSGNGAHIAI
eukprot:scaffold9411_cov129-Isochrysis_galbana.AAC.4